MKEKVREVLSRLRPGKIGWERIYRWVGIATLVLPVMVAWMVVEDVRSWPEPAPMTVTEEKSFGLTEKARRMYFTKIAQFEEHWRTEAKKQFPKQKWSQCDAYFNHVMQHVQHLARIYRVHYSQMFMVLDEGVRKGWTDEQGGKMPAVTEPLRPRTK
jgi:hypothetical protein